MSVILKVRNLSTGFKTKQGLLPAVSNVSFDVKQGKTLGIVGESGCGKSVTAMSILKLLPETAVIEADEMLYCDGEKSIEITKLNNKSLQEVRGAKISMIFQEPMTSLNPLYSVCDQISESLILHLKMTKKQAAERSIELLDLVGIPCPEKRVYDYPHQLSGGMRQRVMIAMALACNPRLLIADEPTTALDVTIQAQILDSINRLQKELNMSVILITHNLGVVAEVAEEVLVMYAGQVIEQALTKEIFQNALHPYTQGLLDAIPNINCKVAELRTIPGTVPSPLFFSKACRFNPRCQKCTEKCKTEAPPMREIEKGHFVRCWYPHKG